MILKDAYKTCQGGESIELLFQYRMSGSLMLKKNCDVARIDPPEVVRIFAYNYAAFHVVGPINESRAVL
ncbi:hypothetical protein Plhal304r1_c092g0172491 [Plasmopara halstedii]